MTRPPTCRRCRRSATFGLACEAGVVMLCDRHRGELAERLAADPRVRVGRREVRLTAPELEGVRR